MTPSPQIAALAKSLEKMPPEATPIPRQALMDLRGELASAMRSTVRDNGSAEQYRGEGWDKALLFAIGVVNRHLVVDESPSPTPAEPQWIDINKQLPPHMTTVAVFAEGHVEHWWRNPSQTDEFVATLSRKSITHWMPCELVPETMSPSPAAKPSEGVPGEKDPLGGRAALDKLYQTPDGGWADGELEFDASVEIPKLREKVESLEKLKSGIVAQLEKAYKLLSRLRELAGEADIIRQEMRREDPKGNSMDVPRILAMLAKCHEILNLLRPFRNRRGTA